VLCITVYVFMVYGLWLWLWLCLGCVSLSLCGCVVVVIGARICLCGRVCVVCCGLVVVVQKLKKLTYKSLLRI
jgi:hypothetical protein